jgi:predicted RNA methylase
MTLVTSMLHDLDKYYTPRDVAERILADSVSTEPRICVDSTCGSGRLLEAANNVFGKVQCVGIDRDKNTIASLRRRNPDWILSVADLMKPSSYKRTLAISENRECDLLVLNPPFSHGNRKSIEVSFGNNMFKCSIAMAHILQSFELFKPTQGAVIIVPESVLYSETDIVARQMLGINYDIEKITELESTTFKGTRARATVISVTPGKKCKTKKIINFVPKIELRTKLIRGGLPVYDKVRYRNGLPYVHTTDISSLVLMNKVQKNVNVRAIDRGCLSGWVILFPRVGVPDKKLFKPLFLKRKTQLSDCVIALKFESKTNAIKVEQRIQLFWDEFLMLYRGTGARYVTVSRLTDWLTDKNIKSI